MTYLLDSNVFIEAKNFYFGFDICPGFWEWLLVSNRANVVFSVEKIKNELLAGDDELSSWARDLGTEFFLPPTEETLAAFSKLAAWTHAQDFNQAAIDHFLQDADFYLLGEAMSSGHTVVTREKAHPTRKQVKIPHACIGVGVKCMTPFEMLRVEQARFVLQSS